jgi:hypothetical protein
MTFHVPQSERRRGAYYRVAMQPWFSEALRRDHIATRTNGRLTNEDLNLLSGAGLMTTPYFLQSAHAGLKGDWMVESRDPTRSDYMADSGGFQVSTGVLKCDEATRYRLLRQCERGRVAPILDGPTSSIANENSFLNSVRECLTFTIDNARYAINNRIPGKVRLQNVIQGLNRTQALDWYQAVKFLNDRRVYGERALEDWAFAGATRLHFSIVLTLIVRMRDEGLILRDAMLHFLGTGHPALACVFTALQEGLRETIDDGIEISFDSATPFSNAGIYRKGYRDFVWNRRDLLLPDGKMPSGTEYVGSDAPWPMSGLFADRLTLGDLNRARAPDAKGTWDGISFALLAAHNVWAMSNAIELAIEKSLLPLGEALRFLPASLIQITEVVREILHAEHPMTVIQRHQLLLDSLAHKSRHTKLTEAWKGIDQ